MIDDDQDDREIFQELILKCYPMVELLFAIDGDQALEILNASQGNPDVIFLDYNMPRMTGVDCLRVLKGQERTKSIPVVMYTSSANPEHETATRLLGADHYLKKSNTFDELDRDIRKVLESIASQIHRAREA